MTTEAPWTLADMPDLHGKRALVTGVTSGLGERTVAELAGHGAEVVMAARNSDKLDATVRDVREAVPGAVVHPLVMDLADLTSVRRAAAEASRLGPLHLLVNNAGVMATPYARTTDGFEMQMGTNHFGHFALTGLLLPVLVASENARVVTIASQGHRMARTAPLHDPRLPRRRYGRWQSYFWSKLANLLFTFELDRRAHAAGLPIKALAAHPGFSATGLMHAGRGSSKNPVSQILNSAFSLLGQPADLGVLPTLMAATADLPGEIRGMPRVTTTTKLARDAEAARELWEISEHATGVTYP